MDFNTPEIAPLTAAYLSVLQNEFNWLLLHYANDNYDDLALYSYGTEGLEELKSKVYDLNQVFVAFYREELPVGIDPGFILINYIPQSVSGVRRGIVGEPPGLEIAAHDFAVIARALVHSRRVGAIFKKHQTMLTVDNLSQLTTSMIHKALVEPESFTSTSIGYPISQLTDGLQPVPKPKKIPRPITLDMIRRSFSETYAPHIPVPQPIPPVPLILIPKSTNVFGNLLRRKKKGGEYIEEVEHAPPTPPKDLSKLSSPPPFRAEHDLPPVPYHPNQSRRNSLSEFAIISHSQSTDEIVIQPTVETPRLNNSQMLSLSLHKKWNNDPPLTADPQERARRRLEAQKGRELKEQEALKEEEMRQTALKRQKEEILKQEQQDETRRRAELGRELKRIAAERKRKECLEQEEEARKRKEMIEHKRTERQKRHQEHQRLEKWRKEQERTREEEARRIEQVRKQEEDERRRKIRVAERIVQQNSMKESVLTGWVTIQFQDSLFWKRRYYKFVGNMVYFYRSPKDTAAPLEEVKLFGNLNGLKEWNEGYEELESIPFSFVIEFKDERGAWSLFSDSEEDKFRLLGLLHLKAGL